MLRFVVSYESGGLGDKLRIIVDTQSGINYIQVCYDHVTRLTPLLYKSAIISNYFKNLASLKISRLCIGLYIDAEGQVVVKPIAKK